MTFGRIRSVIVCLVLVCAACGRFVSTKSELHYGLTLVPTGIDPHINKSSELGIPLASVYDTLVFRDPAGGFVPGLAQRWEISIDGLQYTFFLRHDVHFQDGTPFNAQAVKVNLERILDPANKSQQARFMIDSVQSVTVVDDYTVRLQLAEPFAPLLDSLSQVYLGMASPAALKKWGKDYSFHQVGTGPFRFVEYVPGDHLTLERNLDYAWGPSIYRNKTAQVLRIIFRFYEDPATRAPALLSGEADVMGEVLPMDADSLKKDGRFSVYPVNIPGQPLQFFFNIRQPPTDDVLVRQALLAATDREGLVQTVFGFSSPVAIGPLTASTWGAAGVVPASVFNRESADLLLRQAGWVDSNGDGVREKDGQPLRLKVVYPTWGLTPQVADLLELQWKQIGVAVDLLQVPSFSALVDAQAGGAYNLISINQVGTDPYLLGSYFQTGAANNWTGIDDARLNSLLLDAARSGNDADRLEFYRQAQIEIASQYLILPIRDYVNLNVAARHVQGLHFTAQGWFPVLIDVGLG
ncbi:MAG TPA: ABC transporter substrate-binding protein [Anaerolineales bacterium]